MAASGRPILTGDRQFVAGNRLIGLPIADIQLGKPRGVGKGPLMGGSDLRSATTSRQERVPDGSESR
jgi:hypothetical protein